VIYYYFDDNNYYSHSLQAQGFEGEICPCNATTQAPAIIEGFIPRWVDSAWVNIENHVGEEVYSTADGSKTTVTEYGPYPEGTTTLVFPEYGVWNGTGWDVVKPLEAFKDDLKGIRLEKEYLLVTIDGVPFDIDDKSRSMMAYYVVESITNGLIGVNWKCGDNIFRYYTVQDFKPIQRAVATYVEACYSRESALVDDLEAAQDPSTVDLTVGWPSTVLTT